MILLFYCLLRRHKRYTTARNDTILIRNSVASRRNLPCRKLSSLLLVALTFATLLILLAYKITNTRNHIPLSFSHPFSSNIPYPVATLPSSALNIMRSHISVDGIKYTNDVVNTNVSSVDYMACCGAGHRISKMADAYYLAQRLNFTLRGYWGYCDTVATTGQLTEVFQ